MTDLLTRDIWTHGGGWPVPDLLKSCLGSLLLQKKIGRHVYFASPWITDFELFDNRYNEYSFLFPEISDKDKIMFTDYLESLSKRTQVRILTIKNARSENFLKDYRIHQNENLLYKFGDNGFHEKGILAEFFYIEGSMNLTDHGVRVRGEKVVYHSVTGIKMPSKIAEAYLEIDRHWETRG